MIKFFRDIRQNLMVENKTSKPALSAGRYLKYALGEIVLVVIGILIALQLNILKDKSHEEKVMHELLSGVQADLKAEAERFDFLSAWYSEITDDIQRIIFHQQGIEHYSNEELGQYFLRVFDFRKFYKINTNYQTLYGSGLLQKLEDKEPSNEIIDYYSKMFLEWTLELYQTKSGNFNFNQMRQFDPLDKIHTKLDYHTIPNYRLDIRTEFHTDFNEFIQQPETLNYLIDLLNQSTLIFKNLNTYKTSNLALSERIDKLLKQ